MPKSKLSLNPTPVTFFSKGADTLEEEKSTPEHLPAVISPAYTDSDIEGDIDAGDISLPKLELKHGVDSRFETIPAGKLVYSLSSEEFCALTPPITLIPLSLKKGFIQQTEPGETPAIVWSKAAMEEMGGTIDPGNPEASLFKQMANISILILVDRAEPLLEVASLKVGSETFAPAIYRAKSTAFTATAKVLITYAAFQRMKGNHAAKLIDHRWELSVAKKQGATYSYLVPTLRHLSANTPDQISALREIVANL